jgi:hypothetical protein
VHAEVAQDEGWYNDRHEKGNIEGVYRMMNISSLFLQERIG